jgi:hypothetical protein
MTFPMTAADFDKGHMLIGSTRVHMRSGTTVEWAAADPVLRRGEPGFDLDVRWFKIGDGTTRWTDLTWARQP